MPKSRRRLFKFSLALLLLLALALFSAWAYYLRFSHLEPPQTLSLVNEHSLSHQGYQRTYYSYIPKMNQQKKTAKVVVLVLHGSRMTAGTMRMATAYRFDELAEQHGFIVVYPQGYENHWNDCRATATYSAKLKGLPDVAFMQEIVKDLQRQTHLTTDAKVFMAGYSLGGHLAYRTAMQTDGFVDAIAPVAANFPTPDNNDCEDQGFTAPALIASGKTDPINPYAGGAVTLFGFGERGNVFSLTDTVDLWRKRGATTTMLSFDGGHTIPGRYTFPPLLGQTDTDISWPDNVWQFFSRY